MTGNAAGSTRSRFDPKQALGRFTALGISARFGRHLEREVGRRPHNQKRDIVASIAWACPRGSVAWQLISDDGN
jgi:hypothetical protein